MSVIVFMAQYTLAEASTKKSILPFIAYDKNQDNYVSKSEFYHANAEREANNDRTGMPLMHNPKGPDFYEYDTDLDGQLDEMEFLRSCKACHAQR